MATYALVHGGAHGGWCYRDVARLLRAAGHDVHTPTLTGLEERAHLMSADPQVVDGVELVLFPGTEPMPNYGVTDPDAIAWMSERLTPYPFACFEQPLRLSNEEALWKVPQTHIVCTWTLATRDPARMASAAEAGRVWDIDTGHDLMITEPKAVADLLLRVASA